MRKLIIVVIILAVSLMFVPVSAKAFDAPSGKLYGVTLSGVYYVSKDLVDAARGSAPKAMFGPAWERKNMALSGNYYIFESGKSLRSFKADFCFDIGNNQYIPHILVNDPRINAGDVVDNGVGGYNFRVLPDPK